MTPKEIFELETIGTHRWFDTEAFWSFAYKEIDVELFCWEDAKDETRIVALCKALAEEPPRFSQSYWAITFDSVLVGIIVLWGRVDENYQRYIVNYPLFQAMIGYVKAMYTPIETSTIVGEEKNIEDLEYQFGWVIDANEPYNMKKGE